mgnify:CR=1 FL=1
MTVINNDTKLLKYELFNFINFNKFLEENKAFATASSIVIATQITVIATSFIDNIILPIFNRDVDKDGKPDIKEFENIKLNIYGVKIKPGKLIIDILKFILIIYIVFTLSILYDKTEYILKK